ncbi:MAG TPA: M6 family metalloprotease domain-containing protein, partial [Bacteroidales bacterium]|nr:M6 family metalloprotease domain-containing protein [Bacteroidales bacterium]
MRKLFYVLTTLFVIVCMSQPAFSVPAKPGLIEFTQPDGSTLKIYLHGDEFVKWAETLDGYTLMFNSEGYYEYATRDLHGEMIPSGIVARDIEIRDAAAVAYLINTPKGLFYNQEQMSYLQQIRNMYQAELKSTKAFPTTGDRKLICILIGYTDRPFTKTQADFNALFNQINYTIGSATGSVKDYYLENSYGQFDLTVDVAGPYTASNTLAYYGTNDGSNNDMYPRQLVAEAVNLADPDVDYSLYDNDDNGTVDGVYVIYAGYGEEAGAPSNTIWAHAWSITPVNKDGVSISKYSCSSELRGTSGTNITRIGVICHEFGHVLGAPDYYDTDYSTNGQYDGTGEWDMMANGSWNNNGATPAHHNAYTKIYIYHWAEAITLTTPQNIAMLNAEQNASSFYRYNTQTSNEYFLLENRQKIGFDYACPGVGMIIYHVDGSYIASHTSANNINAASHQGMFPMAANASTANGVMTGSGAVSTSGCPWPGTSAKTSFTDATTPNSKSWAGVNTALPITNITVNGNIIQFCFISCPPACTAPTTQVSGFSTSNIGDNQIQVNWNRGNGTGVIVLARQGSAVDSNPINSVSYTADPVYGTGMEVGNGNYVVYTGAGTNVTVTGLTPGTLYHFAVYEYFIATYCYMLPGITGNAITTGVVPNFCDTLSQFCCTASLYTVTNSGAYAGYLSGTNSYGFEGFAEYFEDHEPYNQVWGMRVYLGEVNNVTNPNVTFAMWDNANGVPTNQLATKIIPLSTIQTAFTNRGYIDIDFDDTISAPANGFYLGLLEPGSAASGDTIAIVTNAQDEGLNSGFTIYGSWTPYNDLFGGTFQHAIYAFACFDNSIPPVAGFVGTPRRVALGETVQFNDASAGTDPTSWTWTFEGGSPASSADANPQVTYETLGFFDVSLTVSNTNGSNSITQTDYIEVFDPNSTTAFSLDFEACTDFQVDNFDPWTTLDVDGKTTYGSQNFDFPNESYTGSFIAFNSANTTPAATGWEAHGGNLCGICMAATTPPNNDWLMSTQIDLGENSSFSFWAKSITDQYGLERFIVYVSTTGNATTDFVKISEGTYVQAPVTWTQYTYNLSAFDNQSVYVAIRCVSNDAYAFMIDDIEIHSVYVAPTCNFIADNTNVLEGSTINFTDLSTQMPTSWQWSFPGGTPATSNEQNPSVVYNVPGTYDVSLTVTNSAGTDSETKSAYIMVVETPEVIVLWDFPNSPDNNVADAGITTNLTKTIVPFGGVSDILYSAAGVTTRSIDGETWASGSGTKGWSVNFSTLGYGTLKLSFAQMSNNAASPRNFKIQYSLNGTSWTDLGVNIVLVEDVWYVMNDIVLPAACENKANVYLRWLMTSNTSCSGGTVSSNLTTRRNAMDNVKVTGYPIITPPVTDFTASSTQICAGQSVTFTDATTNSPTSWAWTFEGGNPSTSNLQSPVVNYSTAGTYQVSLTATNASGSDTETKIGYITVNLNPSVSAANTGPYCVGNTINLNATGSDGTSYSWTGPAGFTSTLEDPTRTNALTTHTGTYTVVLTNAGTGCTASASTMVTVNANPTISASNTGPVCAGQSVSLSAEGSEGNTFSWSGPNSYSSTTEDPSITNAQTVNSGTYTVTYTNTSSNCFATANTIVVVNANPTVSPVNGGPYCVGQTIVLTANGSGGNSYSWTGPNSYANTSTNPQIANAQTVNAGTYTLVLTNTSTGCSVSGTTNVTVNPNPTVSATNNSPICAGSTLTFNATGSGGTSYSWSGPVSFSSSLEDPQRTNALTTHSGAYTVVLSNTTTGCSASATTTATVNANPTVSATNNSPICAGSTL